MGRPVARWNSAGKYLSIVVVLCFFLPFFGVSCDGVDVIHVSGADLVYGGKPGGLAVDMAEESGKQMDAPGHKDDLGLQMTGGVGVDPLAIVAMGAAVLVAAAAFMRGKSGRTLALVFSLVSIGALVGLYIKTTGSMGDQIAEQGKAKPGSLEHEMKKDVKIEAGARFGFWATTAGMLLVAFFAGTAVKQGEDDPLPPPPPQPAGPPPVA